MSYKIVRNTTVADIVLDEVGVLIPANNGTLTIYPQNYGTWADAVEDPINTTLRGHFTTGDLEAFDGITYLTGDRALDYLKHPDWAFNQRFLSEPERSNGFISKNNQEAIEEARQSAFTNDLDKLQFGRQGQTSNNTYLLTINNLVAYDSPDTLKYDIIFRGFSCSVSNTLDDPFTLKLWKINGDHSIRTEIYSEVFSIPNGNFTGQSGYTLSDLSVPVNKGEGVYIQVTNVGNPKPSNLNVLVWTRQR